MPAEVEGDDAYARLYRQIGLENAPREKVEAALTEAAQLAAAAKIGFYVYIDLDALYGSRYCSKRTDLLQIVPQERLNNVQQEQKLQPYYCSYPWTSVYVRADSGAEVCCFMTGSLGRVENGDDLKKVWTEGTITEIRQAISKGEIHSFCRSCIGLGRYQHSSIELDEIRRTLQPPVVEDIPVTVAAE
jgi:hypothetical protein